MNQNETTSTQKLAIAGVLTAAAVAGSLISVPVAGSKCAPVQHWSMYLPPSSSVHGGVSESHSAQA